MSPNVDNDCTHVAKKPRCPKCDREMDLIEEPEFVVWSCGCGEELNVVKRRQDAPKQKNEVKEKKMNRDEQDKKVQEYNNGN